MSYTCPAGHVVAYRAPACPRCAQPLVWPVLPRTRWQRFRGGLASVAVLLVVGAGIGVGRQAVGGGGATSSDQRWVAGEVYFIQECGDSAYCHCVWDRLRATYRIDDLTRINDQANRGVADPGYTAILRACDGR